MDLCIVGASLNLLIEGKLTYMSVNTALLGDETSKILKYVTYLKIVEMIQLDQQYGDVSKGLRYQDP